MKSEIYAQFPAQIVVDITHSIQLSNTIQAAFVIKQLPEFKTTQNIVIALVGSKKDLIAYQHQNNWYIFPNNGLINMVFDSFDHEAVLIFPNSDLMSCISAIKNKKTSHMALASNNLALSYNKIPQVNEHMAVAECLYIDGLGNCYFNLTEQQFNDYVGHGNFKIKIQHYLGHSFNRIGSHISDVSPGSAMFSFNRSGYLCLQINMGNAKQLFRIKNDSKIIIEKQ